VKESRRLLSGVLVTLQEVALADPDAKRRELLLQIAESAAAVMSDLFSLERSVLDDPQRQSMVTRALSGLRGVLSSLQEAMAASPTLESAAEPAAQAVALLFTLASQPVVFDLEPGIPLTRPSRRAAQRAKVDVEVGFVSESTFYAGLSLDISTGGLFVATYDLHPVGTPVAVTLNLPDGHAVVANGVVRWVRESASGEVTPGMGIEFAGLSQPDLEAIEAFCRSRTPMYYDD
jgi:uncharacterized protein (TIGR02266 family)